MRAFCVAGMAFGDESKGAVTDFLTRRHGACLVLRHNGGPQCAHNVIAPDGTHHKFSQFGSGTLAGAGTHLSRFMLLDPIALAREAEVLTAKIGFDPRTRMSIDPETIIITPYHLYANRLREIARGVHRHGSVGLGVGEARSDELVSERLPLRVGDLSHPRRAHDKLATIAQRKMEQLGLTPDCGIEDWLQGYGFRTLSDRYDECGKLIGRMKSVEPSDIVSLVSLYRDSLIHCTIRSTSSVLRGMVERGECVVFEGGQGVLLDETYGFLPYNSWTDCTFANADRLLDEIEHPVSERRRIGVFRSYFTRHGPGPFPTESSDVSYPEQHNGVHPWMGGFRQGWLDLVLAKYACEVAKPDALIVTHMDCKPERVAYRYEHPPERFDAESLFEARPLYKPLRSAVEALESVTGCSVVAVSRGPSAEDFEDRASA